MLRPNPGELMDADGTVLQSLEVWCQRNGITPANARGQYREGIPMRKILGRNFVPRDFVLPPAYARKVTKSAK